MAGIVAQLTKANWERKKNRGKHIPADKSVFNIPPYDETFDPAKHNVYLKRKKVLEEREKARAERAELEEIAQELANRAERNTSLQYQCFKAFVGVAVLSVPFGFMLFLFFTFWGLKQPGTAGEEGNP